MSRALVPETDRFPAILHALSELGNFDNLLFPNKLVPMVITHEPEKHLYWIDGEQVPSVTQILDETEPAPALTWWGFRVGMAAVQYALATGELSTGALLSWDPDVTIKPQDHVGHPDIVLRGRERKPKSRIEALALERKLDPNNRRDERGTVGTSIHIAAEKLGVSEVIPTIEEFPEADRGYVQALARYHVEQDPEIEEQEVIVGSKRFGFAGRFDQVVRMPAGELRLRDFKTSGGVYAKFDLQLALYELAWHDMGRESIAGHDVIHLRPDGTYVLVPTVADAKDALVCLLDYTQRRDRARRLKAVDRKP